MDVKEIAKKIKAKADLIEKISNIIDYDDIDEDEKINRIRKLIVRYYDKKNLYIAVSPDNLYISGKRHYTESEARKEILEWKKRYEAQGYYSTKGNKIPFKEIETYCSIDKLD